MDLKDEKMERRDLNQSSDESDSDIKILPKRPEIKKQNKNGAMWAEMLQEENLMENMKTCEVAINSRKRKIDRGAESYDFNNSDNSDQERKPSHRKDNSRSSHVPERKKFKIIKNKTNGVPRVLLDLEGSEKNDDQFADDLGSKLQEDNLELIKKVVLALGIDECTNYYKKTQEIESNGGMLIFNKQRRRTSGGVFLYLIKNSDKITSEQKKMIFDKCA